MTVRHSALINELLSQLDEKEYGLCEPVIQYLLELGYAPKRHKKKTYAIAFEKLGRVIVKLEYGKPYKADPAPFLTFWLRYSASRDFSPKFQEPILAMMKKHEQKNGARMGEFDTGRCCGICRGSPRLYSHTWEDGTTDSWCGGFTMRFTDLTAGDVPEIRRHIKNQDDFFVETFSRPADKAL